MHRNTAGVCLSVVPETRDDDLRRTPRCRRRTNAFGTRNKHGWDTITCVSELVRRVRLTLPAKRVWRERDVTFKNCIRCSYGWITRSRSTTTFVRISTADTRGPMRPKFNHDRVGKRRIQFNRKFFTYLLLLLLLRPESGSSGVHHSLNALFESRHLLLFPQRRNKRTRNAILLITLSRTRMIFSTNQYTICLLFSIKTNTFDWENILEYAMQVLIHLYPFPNKIKIHKY